MKVLIIRNSPTIINTNNYNVQEIGLAKSLISKGNEVGIVFYTDGNYKEDKIKGITIYYVPAKKILNYAIFDNKIYELCDKYDIIQTAEYNQIMSFRLCKKYPNKAIIYHGPYYRKNFVTIVNNKLFDFIYLRRYLKINPNIMTKSFLAEDFLKKKGFSKIATVGVGLDAEKFSEDLKTNDEFELVYDKNDINLLCIARIEKNKNTLFLLKVLNELVKENNKYKLYLIGKSTEKSYKQLCLKYIKDNNLESNVVFIESVLQNELPSIYKKSDFFLLASDNEIFGMVLLEAAYFGISILSSLNGGSSYLLEKENVVDKFDVNLWKDRILKHSKKNRIKSKILWNDIANDFIKEYKKIIQ